MRHRNGRNQRQASHSIPFHSLEGKGRIDRLRRVHTTTLRADRHATPSSFLTFLNPHPKAHSKPNCTPQERDSRPEQPGGSRSFPLSHKHFPENRQGEEEASDEASTPSAPPSLVNPTFKSVFSSRLQDSLFWAEKRT
mmetsp:Transcript_46148/g.90957  ORF Transcript_46148/g.90957 Transcript_46148/m.90957 type:complete len:138 (+) Transcript_46148:244-657(+)